MVGRTGKLKGCAVFPSRKLRQIAQGVPKTYRRGQEGRRKVAERNILPINPSMNAVYF
jgi:hypothetical protein